MNTAEKNPIPSAATELQQARQYYIDSHEKGRSDSPLPATPFEDPWSTIQEVAKRWRTSEATIRRRFRYEPGVVHLGTSKVNRRTYDSMRIPRSVERRVMERCRQLSAVTEVSNTTRSVCRRHPISADAGIQSRGCWQK